jgi:hypothetical protein|tara:strand:- start:60 stop:251 length:192 start_codon:yes stop_codon:yes gene_type:complete
MSAINRATFTSPEDLVNFDVWVSGSNNNNKVWELNLEELYIDFIVGVSDDAQTQCISNSGTWS